jgi:hypothetical protein
LVGSARGVPERQLGDAVETADRVTLWGTALAGFAATVRRHWSAGSVGFGSDYRPGNGVAKSYSATGAMKDGAYGSGAVL